MDNTATNRITIPIIMNMTTSPLIMFGVLSSSRYSNSFLNGLLIAFRFLLSSFKEAINSDTNSGPSEKEYEPSGKPSDLAAKKSGETEEEKACNQAGK